MFYKAAPVKKSELLDLLEVKTEQLEEAVTELKKNLSGTFVLVENDENLELVLNSSFDDLIETIRKDELKRDIGKAGAETLAIVLYRGPVSRGEIDHIRGVNSAYILRSLETRGLVEKDTKGRRTEYRPTIELLKHLGLREKAELPDYQTIMDSLEQYEESLTPES